MNTKKGTRASWLWSSLLEGRKVLQGNLLASVGDGESTCVWNDPWIPNLPGKTLFHHCPLSCFETLKVAALRLETGWDLSPIDEYLSDDERHTILNSRYRSITSTDKWLLCYGKWHTYTVKDGYKVAHNVILRDHNKPSSSYSNNLNPLWKTIWKLKVPNKIRFFMWKIFSDALPTFVNLFKRNSSKTNLCMICKSKPETLPHLFCQCPWVRRLWFACPFTFLILSETNFNLHHWLIECLTSLKLSDWEKGYLCTLMWHIWKCRNAFVYSNSPTDCAFILSQTGKSLAEYWDANALTTSPPS